MTCDKFKKIAGQSRLKDLQEGAPSPDFGVYSLWRAIEKKARFCAAELPKTVIYKDVG